MLYLHFVLLVLFTSEIGSEPEVAQRYRRGLVCEDISTKIENRDVACMIEHALRDEGFESPLIKAVLLNAYAESKFNPKAVGDNGNSKGVFQLNKNGLGHRMTDEEMYNVRKSSKRVAIAIRKSKRIQDAIGRGAETGELTRLFCTEIMRPSNKHRKAVERASFDDEFFVKSPPERGQLRSH